MSIYIRSSACVSAQPTLTDQGFLTDIAEYTGTRLPVIDPDYKRYIDPKLIRRMSHVIKMGVAAARQCLMDAGTDMPGAIITGTAFGCMEDTITFMTRLVEGNEEMLPPTAFIQSTHNTVAAQIALLLQCHNYNSTYVHKGLSFESALTDAIMLLNEKDADTVLVGGTEEMVDTSFKVLTRLGLYRRKPVSNLQLLSSTEKGTIGGEGAAFVLLGSEPSANDMAKLDALATLYKPQDIHADIKRFMDRHEIDPNDIDLLVLGNNGDIKNDQVYHELEEGIFKNVPIANYKHLCGEYPVASSFALWMAANILKTRTVPPVAMQKDVPVKAPKKILLYNHYQMEYHSLMLVSAVN